ncbi:helix-turn-helix transcriptional regulator [Patulibacter sp. NPDC049589]|uniref:helix-turn-helix transcriptional regulator n=1 Tax=Patulibacter sp. NPDC049589 TaxID=3154731 RepID=UPI003440B92C
MDAATAAHDAPLTRQDVDDVVARSARERARAAAVRRTISGTGDGDLIAVTRHVRERLRAPEVPDAWIDAYARLVRERRAVDAHDDHVRRVVRAGVRDAIGVLRGAPTSWSLVDGAARAVCDAGGFTRSMVSAVRGSRWVPLVVHTRDDLDPKAEAFRSFVGEHVEIPLASMLGETEMVRRRTALRFDDPVHDRRTFKPIIRAAGSPAYAAAPIVVGTRTLGFLHIDRVGQDQPITEDDRLAVGAFAADLGWLFDRASSEEALARRAEEIERAIDAARAALAPLRDPGDDRVIGETARDHGAATDDAPAGRDALLTAREREILELVSDGATNWAVAERLTLSEETVKTHMRTIRRKLHVKSRGAAVARFRRLRGSG